MSVLKFFWFYCTFHKYASMLICWVASFSMCIFLKNNNNNNNVKNDFNFYIKKCLC